jgi:formate hydrogenlyase subunit 3/multisubunit Na+/H+ antiporter MnhD subunit
MMSASLPLLLPAAMAALAPVSIALGGWARRSEAVYLGALAISLLLLALALAHLLSAAPPLAWRLPLGLPWIGARFRIDALAAFFVAVVNLGGAAASLYGLGYGRHETSPGRVLPFYVAFLAGMNFVVLADDAFTFLFSWEFMSLASWALVLVHHRESDNTRAGYVYLVMAGFSTACLLLAFGLLAGATGAYAFADMREATPTAGIAALVLALALLGAGSKAGLVPLHAWLPLAHPAAPSHVSALMSGVMTKVAVYGVIRIVFDLSGPATWWAGLAALLLGGVTAVLGVLYALMQHDLKRLLAYHTVENIGIIFIGLGLALAFRANAMPAAAALALTAALFHVLNHSLFKSLLFFGSGAVLSATGERDMEHLGGLIHRMPVTSLTFLAGCVAISALPPLNGFVSEWLTFQAILISPSVPQWALKMSIPAVGALLALSAALAAACFVKAFGVTFLGRPRTRAAELAAEVDRFSLTAMLFLTALCVLAGVFPGFVIDRLAPAVVSMVEAEMPRQAASAWLSVVPIADQRSSYNGLLVFLFVAFAAAVPAIAVHRFATRPLRRSDPWDCGFPDQSPMTQYSAGSFAQPIRRVFGTLVFAAREHVEMPPPGGTAPARLTVDLRDLIWDWFYAPVAAAVGFASLRLNALQFLTIRKYLGLVFGTLVTLLVALALWP